MTDNNFKTLVASITGASNYFQLQAQKQVNVALTLRNWMIGAYLVEYELHGSDRAVYGQGLFKALTQRWPRDFGQSAKWNGSLIRA